MIRSTSRHFEILKNFDVKHSKFIQSFSKPQHVLIDYSSPNIAKPFHYGHLRSTIHGNFIANLNVYFNNSVTRLNYLGDWGTQFGLLNLGLKETDFQFSNENFNLKELIDIYVEANKRALEDKSFLSKAKYLFSELENGANKDLRATWTKIRNLSVTEFTKSYSNLGINFDAFDYESEYAKPAKFIGEQMLNDGIAFVKDNAITIRVQKNSALLEVPLLKNDGSSLYISRDIAAALKRKEKFKFNKCLYVAGRDQEKHFFCLFDAIKQLGHQWHEDMKHIGVGKVRNMRTRQGNVTLMQDILDEATHFYSETTKNTVTSKVSNKEEIPDVARHLALSALFVYDLRKKRQIDYSFDWKKVMSSPNLTGIDMQSTHARLNSLIVKSLIHGITENKYTDEDQIQIQNNEAENLIDLLDKLDETLLNSYKNHEASYIVNYGLDLCRAINKALHCLNVIRSPTESSASVKLDLFKKSKNVINLILRLIGLTPLDRT